MGRVFNFKLGHIGSLHVMHTVTSKVETRPKFCPICPFSKPIFWITFSHFGLLLVFHLLMMYFGSVFSVLFVHLTKISLERQWTPEKNKMLIKLSRILRYKVGSLGNPEFVSAEFITLSYSVLVYLEIACHACSHF